MQVNDFVMIPQPPLHGWVDVAVAYSSTLIGMILGLRFARAGAAQFRRAPLSAVPVTLMGALLWGLMHEAHWVDLGAQYAAATVLLGFCFLLACGVVAGFFVSRARPSLILKRGAVILGGPAGPRIPPSEALTLAGQPVPLLDETKHFKLVGTTGTGKSTAIRELLGGALGRGDRAVIADPDGSYMRAFYHPERGDVILNPFDTRSARWDLFAEVREPYDADQLARSLIPDYEGSDRNWRQYARTFLTAILRQLHRVQERDPAALYRLLIVAPQEELRELLADTAAGPFLGNDNVRFFESVRSVTITHMASVEHIARQQTGKPLSVRRWIRESRAGVLFLPYRASEIAALRHLISTWMRVAIFEAMNAEEADQKLWFVIDELDALGAIDGLKDALARLRKFGGRCVLGLQSIAQIRGTYGDADAQTIVENCGTTLILRCSASERGGTSEFVSRLIGKREVVRQQVSRTRSGAGLTALSEHSKTLSEQQVTEDAVMASEIEQLPDLAGFLKLASQPSWRRVSIGSP
jgi:hypothetical protein